MNKFIVKPNKTLEEITRLNKKSRIVLEPKERFIEPYKEFNFERSEIETKRALFAIYYNKMI